MDKGLVGAAAGAAGAARGKPKARCNLRNVLRRAGRPGQASIHPCRIAGAKTLLDEVRRKCPTLAATSKGVMHLLLDLSEFDEVETMVREGQKRYPRYELFAQGYILAAHQRGDLQEALRRCESIRRKFPRLAEGSLLLVLALPRLATPLRPKPSSNEACGWFRTKLSYMSHAPPSRPDVASGRRPSGVGRSCDPLL